MSVHEIMITVPAPAAGKPNDALFLFKDSVAKVLENELTPGVEGLNIRSLKDLDSGIVESISLTFNLKH
jgi:hypothetical protein